MPAYDAVRDALGRVPLLIMYLQPLFINKLFRAAFALQQSLVLVKVSPMPIEADFAADPKATPKALDRLFFPRGSFLYCNKKINLHMVKITPPIAGV